jgi:16S rRNA (uracil1498-N3)-methyltransferase
VEHGREPCHRGADGLITFFASEPLASGATTVLGEDVAHHARVRRIDVGERVRLVDGAGMVGRGTIVRLSRASVAVDVERVERVEPPAPVHLLVPVADRERMLWLAEKCAELGAASWRPVLWRRSRSVSPRGEGSGFQQKVRARMVAALEQSGGAWLPTLYPDATVERAIAAAPPGEHLLLDAAGAPALARRWSAPIALAVGPEGGAEEDEREQFLRAGWVPVALGGSILRFETAGVAALAVARTALAASPETRDA